MSRSPTPTSVFKSYWHFASERQAVYYRRLRGLPPPWTDDPIIAGHRFTNAFRAADRESQFLIRHVIADDAWKPADAFFRIVLFRLFNKEATWRLMEQQFHLVMDEFNPDMLDAFLTEKISSGTRLFSAAYIMPSRGRGLTARRKHTNLLAVLQRMLDDEVPERVFELSACNAFKLLRSYPMFGNFLAYQYLTDLGYCQLAEFEEADFVMPGPGARDGLKKCFSDFGGLDERQLIRWVYENQVELAREAGVEPPTLFGRPLQLIDCQNLFCEVDKYARVAHPEVLGHSGRSRIKQKYKASLFRKLPVPTYPQRWGLAEAVNNFFGGNDHGLSTIPRRGTQDIPVVW